MFIIYDPITRFTATEKADTFLIEVEATEADKVCAMLNEFSERLHDRYLVTNVGARFPREVLGDLLNRIRKEPALIQSVVTYINAHNGFYLLPAILGELVRGGKAS